MIRGDTQHLDPQGEELLMVVPPGRQVGNSGRAPIGMVELEQHELLASEIAEPNLPARGGRELEIWRPVAHLHCRYLYRQGQQRRKHDGRQPAYGSHNGYSHGFTSSPRHMHAALPQLYRGRAHCPLLAYRMI